MARSRRAAWHARACDLIADRKVSEIAYGQQRLLEIALALALEAEGAAARRAGGRRAAKRYAAHRAALAELPADLAVLMIEHDMDLVFRFAKRVIVLAAGAIIFDGSPQDVTRMRGCAKPISGAMPMPAAPLEVKDLSAGYGPTRVLEECRFSRAGRIARSPYSAATAWARRRCWPRSPARRGAMAARSASAARISPASKARSRARGGLGYVPQARCIFPSLTVEENLFVGLKDRDRARHRGSLRDVPAAARAARATSAAKLSGGEQQMLSTARTILGRPTVLLLDEPLEGLAPVICEELMAALLETRLRRRDDDRFWSSSASRARSISPTGSSSSSAAASPGRGSRRNCPQSRTWWKNCSASADFTERGLGHMAFGGATG